MVDMTGVEGIAHTHPYFTLSQGRAGRFSASATNRANNLKGPGDHLPVVNNGVPNYFRTSTGNRAKTVERINGRIRTRTVWSR